MKVLFNRISGLFSSLFQFGGILSGCLGLSWRVSAIYTGARLVCLLLIPLFTIINSYIIKNIINFLVQNNDMEAYKICIVLVFFLFIVRVVKNVLLYSSQYLQKVHNEAIMGKLTKDLMDVALSSDAEKFDNPDYYNQMQIAGRDIYSISDIIWNALALMGNLVNYITIFFLLASEIFVLPLIISLTIIPSAFCSTKYAKKVYKFSVEKVPEERMKSYYFGVSLDKRYVKELRLYNIGELLKSRYMSLRGKVFSEEKEIYKDRSIKMAFFDMLTEVAYIIIIAYFIWKVLRGQITIGDYSFYSSLVGQFIDVNCQLVNSGTQIIDNKLKISNVVEIIDTRKKNDEKQEETSKLTDINKIEFRNVSFRYTDSSKYVLNDISFIIRQKEKVAIVGMNGSGKSTVVKLLLRLYEPTKGCILINDIDIKQFNVEDLRSKFSVYFQEINNFCFSLRENIAISDYRNVGDDKKIFETLVNTGCDDILQVVKNDIDISIMRLIDENGVELSGGQYQKVSIARAIFKDFHVLVLDEPTANLDPKSEYVFLRHIEQITKNKIYIFISHKLSNVDFADKVIVMRNGSIVEMGKAEELLENKGLFSELYNYQKIKR